MNPSGNPATGNPATGNPATGASVTGTPTPPAGASPARFRTRITELFGIEHPILLGGLHHLGESGIVAAMVNAGGMGFVTSRSFATLDAFRADLRRCRELTAGKPFGVNLTISRRPGFNRDVSAWIDIALEEGVRLFESAGSAPDEIVEPIHRGGGLLLHKCPSVRHAVTAQRLEAAGAHARAGAQRPLSEARLALVAQRQDLDPIEMQSDTVQGHVSGGAKRNDQLAQLTFDGPPDKGMPFENGEGVEDHLERGGRRPGVSVVQEVQHPLEVVECPLTQRDAGHRSARLRRTHRHGLSPRRAGRGRRSRRPLPCKPPPQVGGHLFTGVQRPALIDLFGSRQSICHEGGSHVGQRDLRLQRIDHPRVRRLPLCRGQRRDAVLQIFRQLQGGGHGHGWTVG